MVGYKPVGLTMVVCGVCGVWGDCDVTGEAAEDANVFGRADVGVCGAELTGAGCAWAGGMSYFWSCSR